MSPWAYRIPRVALGAVFVYAGAVKLADPAAFAALVGRYGMAPDILLPLIALGLPALEVLAGLGLILDVRGSLALVSAMLILFAFVLWFGALQGLDIDCGCFSSSELAEHGGLRQALYRDLMMLAVSAYLYYWRWLNRAARRPAAWRLSYFPHSHEARS